MEKEIEVTDIIAVPTEDTYGLSKGKSYKVSEINMGQSNTAVIINGLAYNSIKFRFYIQGKEIDIYRSGITNPYIRNLPKIKFL